MYLMGRRNARGSVTKTPSSILVPTKNDVTVSKKIKITRSGSMTPSRATVNKEPINSSLFK